MAPPLFEHLVPAEKGFPNPVTMAGVQDHDGFIWFGTQGGLGRWDGYRMRNFVFSADIPGSLPGDNIQTIHVDRQGRLWVGTTTDGLAMYDKHTESFVRFPAGKQGLSSPNVGAIASDERGGIWVGTGAGLDYIDTSNGNAIQHFKRDGVPPASNQIRALLIDQRGDLWIGSTAGLARRSVADGHIEDVALGNGTGDAVLALAGNAKGEVVFGTYRSGIGKVSVEHGVARARILSFDQVENPGTAMVLSIAETVTGQWWAATYGGGIIEFDGNGHGRRIVHRPAMATSLGHDRVAAVWRDRSGLMWVSNERGVDVYNPANRIFDTVLDGVGLPEISASAFMTDSGGRLWVALGDQGIDLIGADGIRRAGLRPDVQHPETSIPNRMIVAMVEAEPGEAWIGTLLGLYHTSAHGSRVRRVPLPQADALPRIGSIVRQGEILWLGTPAGLVRFDPKANTLQTIGASPASAGGLSDSRITTMLADPDGALWIGTRNGLNRFDPASGKVEQILADIKRSTALPQGLINSLALDARGRLWVGTNSAGIGVLEGRLPDGQRRFLHVGPQAGLAPAAVNGLVPDQQGRMWAATNHGVAVIDITSLRARMLERGEGLLFQTYYGGAAGKTAGSDIVFGTAGGYVVVHPQLLQDWRYLPQLAVSAVRLDQKEVAAAPLLGAAAPGLDIPAGTRNVEIEVAALDYSASQRNRYAFRLEGYDKDWVDTDASRRVATYANVPPGRYRLYMRGSNRDGVWSPHTQVMQLNFLPAWYQTWWARLGAGLGALALGWGLYRWRVRQLRFTQLVLTQQVYSRTQHLERVNSIVKSINEELDFDALLRTILRESSVIGEQRASYALICEAGSEQLSVRASWQQAAQALSQGVALNEAEISLVRGADCIAPDIFLSRQGKVLAVRICVEHQVHGYLVFEQDVAFAAGDLELFKALKEPFVSAFQKANAIHAIQQARRDAEASARAKSDFLANISHEIRTPMNAILGFADLGKHLDLPPKPRDYFHKIGRAGQNLLGIIDDVLDFSKIESGKLRLEAVPFELTDVLGQIADLFSLQAAEKGLELLVWAAPDVPQQMTGDPLRLSQVLVNLVGNALKFTAQGHVELRVERAGGSAATGQPAPLRFVVEDSGVGISAEQQRHLFRAFSQGDSSTTRVYGGTGLGLAISQQLVHAMGGVIEIDSVPGEGSRFYFSVTLDQQAQSPAATDLPPLLRGKRILVVDACPPVADMLGMHLGAEGFAVRVARSGDAAFEMLRAEPADLLLVDWKMPGLNGIEVAQQLRQLPHCADMPVLLMVTELTREAIATAAAQADIHLCLVKPLDMRQLREAVWSAFGIAAAPGTESATSAPGLSEAALRLRGARVLVVDDSEINRQVAREVLLRAQVQVALAANGAEAIQLVTNDVFDAVLMDIQMPGMDGYQATARIRALADQAELPVIAMTAHAVAGFRESSLARGMNDYVTKPVEAERLFSVLARWIARDPEYPGALAPEPASAAQAQAGGGIVEIEAVLARLGGNRLLLAALLDKFVQEFASAPQRLRQFIEQGAMESAALLAHKTRGAAANLSMPELYRTAGELELELLSAQLDKVEQALAAFSAALQRVTEAARQPDQQSRQEVVSLPG